MHFKGCSYLNHKISCDLSCTLTIFLAFHNLFTILVHMEVHSKYHLLMVHSIQIRSRVWHHPEERSIQKHIFYVKNLAKMKKKCPFLWTVPNWSLWNSISRLGLPNDIQLYSEKTTHSLHKPYVNEVTLTRQNTPLQCCLPHENLT